MVTILPPGGGRRVRTVAHLMCGPVDEAAAALPAPAIASIVAPPADWKADMEQEVAALKQEVASLRETVDRLKVLLD